MQHTIVSLTKKLVSIKSVPGDIVACRQALDCALAELKGFTIERFEHKGVRSALVYAGKKRPKRFKILLNGHLDIIAGKVSQYIPRIQGGRLYGVGALDMKASVACLISVFREMARTVDYPLGLQLVTDEEVGGFCGTQYQIVKGVRADFVIAGEPTNFDIVNQAKGIVWIKAMARGTTAHGAYPWRGKNAILLMNQFLNAVQKQYPEPRKEVWTTTVNVAKIETTNQAVNKIPDDCVAYLDIRYIGKDANAILKTLRRCLPHGVSLDVVAQEGALMTDVRNVYVRRLKQICSGVIKKKVIVRGAHGSSDARHFARVGISGIEFGPVGGGIGADREWVEIKSLMTYCDIVRNFLGSFSA